MRSFCLLLAALLLLSTTALAAETGGSATIYYQGHASMRITTDTGETIYIDPYIGDGYEPEADLILITHGHSDHNQLGKIANRKADCQIITQKEALKDGAHQSFDLGYVKVMAVEAGNNSNHSIKSCLGYVLTFSNGKTVYISGDTSTTDQMAELKKMNLDYAFFCCDGVYNMGIEEATQCAKLVAAKHTIPYHFGAAANKLTKDEFSTYGIDGLIVMMAGDELKVE